MTFTARERTSAIRRMERIRSEILIKYPFYGYLLMHIRLDVDDCDTLYANMKTIAANPHFIKRLSDEELEFAFLHEILHIILLHPMRTMEYNPVIHNLAADTVVNSLILQTMGRRDMTIAGNRVPHLIMNKEGHQYSTEEICEMLMEIYKCLANNKSALQKVLKDKYGNNFDEHEQWDMDPKDITAFLQSKEWQRRIQEAAKYSQDRGNGKDAGYFHDTQKIQIDEISTQLTIDWRKALHDFIQLSNENYDYTFTPPDRRFSSGDIFLPDYHQVEQEEINNLWFVIDTSGSMDRRMVSHVYHEVESCIEQFETLEGMISYFDVGITKPRKFQKSQDLKDCMPIGGGGTDFGCIFDFMREHMKEKLPTAIIIMTDGYASFPKQEEAYGVPVLWVIVDSDVNVPWGQCIHVNANYM